MLVHSPQQLKYTSDRSLSVILNGNILAQVKQAKVLGLTLDEFLIWTKDSDNLCTTINSRLALLHMIKPFLTVLFVSITPVLIQALSTAL
jgi:hypothetical protein